MGTRRRLLIRAFGLLAGTALAASVVLGAPAPAASASATSAGPSGVAARSAAVENAATGKLLWSRGLNTERPMASITKAMTAYLVIRAGHLDSKITIPAAVTGYVRAHNASSAGLRPGDRLTARQLLYALLLPSGVTQPTAASGINGTLGLLASPNGGQQVTYNGWPLYTWVKDTAPGMTTGQNVGGKWFVATPSVAPAT